MAHIEIWWKCPGCHRHYDTQREANRCAISHVRPEKWAVSDKYPGKNVACNYRGEKWALREADLSDLIEEREKDLAELAKETGMPKGFF